MSDASNHIATQFFYIVGIFATVGDVMLYIRYLSFRANKIRNERQLSASTQSVLNTISLFILVYSFAFFLLFCFVGAKILEGFLLHSVVPGLFFLALYGAALFWRLRRPNREEKMDVYDLRDGYSLSRWISKSVDTFFVVCSLPFFYLTLLCDICALSGNVQLGTSERSEGLMMVVSILFWAFVYETFRRQNYYAAAPDLDSSYNESEDEVFRIRTSRSAGPQNRKTSGRATSGAATGVNSGRTFYYSSSGDGKNPSESDESSGSAAFENGLDHALSISGSEETAGTAGTFGSGESLGTVTGSVSAESARTITGSDSEKCKSGKKYGEDIFGSGKYAGTEAKADAGSGSAPDLGSSPEPQIDENEDMCSENENAHKKSGESSDSAPSYKSSYSDSPFTRFQNMTDELKDAYIVLGVAADAPSAAVFSSYRNLVSKYNVELREIGSRNNEYSVRRGIRCRKRLDIVQNAWKTITMARAIRYVRFD